jgi:putative transposase
MIESINYQLRKITKTRGHFPNDDALIKLLYLGCKEIGRTDRGKGRGGRNGYIWKAALNQFEIMYPDRLRLA